MTDKSNLNERITSRRATPVDDDPDASEDCGAFGFLRGVKDRAVMLDLRMMNGNHQAFPYALLEQVAYNPSEGLKLHFMGAVVSLTGSNFHHVQPSGISLLDALHRHRVPWIAETEELRSSLKPSNAAVITKIAVSEK